MNPKVAVIGFFDPIDRAAAEAIAAAARTADVTAVVLGQEIAPERIMLAPALDRAEIVAHLRGVDRVEIAWTHVQLDVVLEGFDRHGGHIWLTDPLSGLVTDVIDLRDRVRLTAPGGQQ